MQDDASIGQPIIYRFHNHTDAAMCACEMRADGHRAYLLDEASSWLWGPLSVGGIRVAVYPRDPEEIDDTASQDDEPSIQPRWHRLPEGCGIFTLAFITFGLISQAIAVLQGLVTFAILIGIATVAGLLMMPITLWMVSAIRNRHQWNTTTRWLLLIILILFGYGITILY